MRGFSALIRTGLGLSKGSIVVGYTKPVYPGGMKDFFSYFTGPSVRHLLRLALGGKGLVVWVGVGLFYRVLFWAMGQIYEEKEPA